MATPVVPVAAATTVAVLSGLGSGLLVGGVGGSQAQAATKTRVSVSAAVMAGPAIGADINPNLPGAGYWTVSLQRLTGGTWRTVRTARTTGAQEIVRFPIASGASGTYRVMVPATRTSLAGISTRVAYVAPTPGPTPTPTPTPTQPGEASWMWQPDKGLWAASKTPPSCTFPIVPDGGLVDLSSAVSFIQPGAVRAGSYKPHGGLRWSTFGSYVSPTTVRAPFSGKVVGVWQYLLEGKLQFGANIVHPCGFMLRLGHLHEPSPFFANLLAKLPPPVEGDSRENGMAPVDIPAGTVIATKVGNPPPASPDTLGTFIDFGLLDLRAPNPRFVNRPEVNADLKYAKFSVCWYEQQYMGSGDRARIAALPFSDGNGSSDYCVRDS